MSEANVLLLRADTLLRAHLAAQGDLNSKDVRKAVEDVQAALLQNACLVQEADRWHRMANAPSVQPEHQELYLAKAAGLIQQFNGGIDKVLRIYSCATQVEGNGKR